MSGAVALSRLDGAASFAPVSRPERVNSADPGLRAFVIEKRRLGASWGAIARMVARPEPDVRAAFDPDYLRVQPAAAVSGASPDGEAEPPPRLDGVTRLGPAREAVLRALVAGASRSVGIAKVAQVSLNSVPTHLARLRAQGLVRNTAYGVYAATPKGLALAERLPPRAPGKHSGPTARTQALIGLADGATRVRDMARRFPGHSVDTLGRALARLRDEGFVEAAGHALWRLTERGVAEARARMTAEGVGQGEGAA